MTREQDGAVNKEKSWILHRFKTEKQGEIETDKLNTSPCEQLSSSGHHFGE